MNALADPFKQLVERRLWPVALLLVAALVAVPMLLAKEPEETVLPTATAGVPAGQGATESIVSLGDPAARDEVRAVLGDRKDPFRPAQLSPLPKVEDSLGTAPTAVSSGPAPSAGGGSSAPSVTVDGDVNIGTDPVTPDPTPDPVVPEPTADPEPRPEPKPSFELHSLKVRFGDPSSGLQTRNVKRLTGLPGDDPVALYLGVTDNAETAVFLVDATVEVVGDGRCDPAPDNCETLEMKPGETVFLTREDQQFELDLIDIVTRKTTDAAKARKARTQVADGGRRALKRMGGGDGYRYSERAGTLTRIARADRGLRAAFTSTG